MQGRLCTDDRQQLQTLQAVWNQANTQIANAAAASASCMAPTLGARPAGTADPFPYNAQAMPNSSRWRSPATSRGSRACSTPTRSARSRTPGSGRRSRRRTTSTRTRARPRSVPRRDLYNEHVGSVRRVEYPQQLIDIDAWYAQQVASLAYTLSQLKTASGKNLLDQTVICWGSELDMGAAHNHDDTPFVLIGGGGALQGEPARHVPAEPGEQRREQPADEQPLPQ